jgi:hypothetical protein
VKDTKEFEVLYVIKTYLIGLGGSEEFGAGDIVEVFPEND